MSQTLSSETPGGGRCWAAVAAVWLGLQAAATADAETWTNRAGHVINARLVGIEGGQVILQSVGTNGRTWRLPLTSLKPADQQRARAQSGTEPVPSDLKACLNQAEEDIRRAAQFLQGGRVSREEYEARCKKICTRFEEFGRAILKERRTESNTPMLDRLRVRLDQTAIDLGKGVTP
jgi:hypothetical protein